MTTLSIDIKKIILWTIIVCLGLFGLYFFYDQNKLFATDQLSLQSQDAQNIFEKCRHNNTWRKCYSKEFVSYNKSHTLEQTVAAVATIQAVDKRVKNCHLFAHTIANNEMNKNTNNWRNTVSKMDPELCGGGFIHGAVESLRIFNPDFTMNKTNILDLCTLVSDDKTSVNSACLHGVGHILFVEHGGDIDASREICLEFAPKTQSTCLTGVFMEYMTGETLARHTGIPRKKPTWDVVLLQEKTCDEYSDLSSQICWREMMHSYSTFAKGDYKKAHELCSRAPDEEAILECYLYLMNYIVVNNKPSVATLQNYCVFYEESDIQYKRCIDNVVFGLTYNLTFDKTRAQNYCKTMDDPYKKYCLNLVDAQQQKHSSSEMFTNLH